VNFENFKGLKDCPTHQGRHICKAHKADAQQPTLQKSLPCSYAQETLCGATQAHIINDHGEKANVQQGVCQNTGRRKLSSIFFFAIVLHIQLDIIYLTFCCYLHLQFFNHHRFRADGILIPVLRQALSDRQNLPAPHYLTPHGSYIFAALSQNLIAKIPLPKFCLSAGALPILCLVLL
jgi:hypothetical protein